ncbi:Sialic acid TRAP transporter permease protein SiaT [Roseivivax jejudonensis]|uniref:Sialic acid TRAP transporter permease protein SiaT n=1 Tax=Roseivivax jejudonensis TaxID=1529041 RepID=A0A1X6ZVD3_9RHOB|nr:TRAP transporter large permease subunit [Roseivivax jejudonensis]SLN62883.1 Sialic acid TRAP transporter permease protein SiaT [Roseivivax jejudonensis]
MIELIAHNLAPIMFISVMGLLLLGYPVALTLAGGGLIFFVIGVGLSDYSNEINLFWPLLRAMPERVFGIMSNDTLLAIPFFTFMGLILERSGMAEDLLDTVGQLFGPLRGGVAFAVILVGALLAATTGVVAASVIAMGLISLPIMQRYQYDPSVATGTIAAAGTLAQIVPPSLVLIVMADQLGVSVGDMYLGALYPALIVIGVYCLYMFALTLLRPSAVPALPPEERRLGGGIWSLLAMFALAAVLYVGSARLLFDGYIPATRTVFAAAFTVIICYGIALANRYMRLGLLSRLAEEVVIVLIPPLALIFLVLGTIFLGIATPTEGGAMGAVGALILAVAKRRLDLKTLRSAVEATAKLSAFVLFILIGARVFGLTFYGVNGQVWLEELLLGLPGGQFGFLVVVTIVIFILGCFLDFFEIAFILVPLLAPVAETLGIDLIWFGVILSMNLQTSFLTPPFGFALFYLRSVAPGQDRRDTVTGGTLPGIRTPQIYKGVLPYIGIQFLLILLVISVPSLVTHYQGDRQPPPTAPAASGDSGGTGFNFGGGSSGEDGDGGSSDGGAGGGFNFGGGSSDGGSSGTGQDSGGGFNFGGSGGSSGENGSSSDPGTSSGDGPSDDAPDSGGASGAPEGGFNFGGGDDGGDDEAETSEPQEGSGGFNFGN